MSHHGFRLKKIVTRFGEFTGTYGFWSGTNFLRAERDELGGGWVVRREDAKRTLPVAEGKTLDAVLFKIRHHVDTFGSY